MSGFSRPLQTNPSNSIDRVAGVFGRNSIQLVNYDKAKHGEGGLLTPFLKIVGYGKPQRLQLDFNTVNQSVIYVNIELIRLLNKRWTDNALSQTGEALITHMFKLYLHQDRGQLLDELKICYEVINRVKKTVALDAHAASLLRCNQRIQNVYATRFVDGVSESLIPVDPNRIIQTVDETDLLSELKFTSAFNAIYDRLTINRDLPSPTKPYGWPNDFEKLWDFGLTSS